LIDSAAGPRWTAARNIRSREKRHPHPSERETAIEAACVRNVLAKLGSKNVE
jgi:hypothetical protein